VSQHAFRPPAQDILQPILASLGAVNVFVRPPEPIAPIVGIKVFQGLACTMKDCNYLAAATRTMQDHFAKTHKGFSFRSNTAECDLQRLFEYRAIQTLIRVDLNLLKPPQELAFTDYVEEITTNLQADDPDIYHVERDTRKHGTFLAKMRWNKAIEGTSITTALQAVASPGDEEQHLQALLAATFQWLSAICIVLPNLDVTYLRWINTSKG
jgi:hypothetical protein